MRVGGQQVIARVLTSLGVSPASNRQEDFEVTLLHLEQVELLEAPVKVVASLIPGIASVTFLRRESATSVDVDQKR